MDPFTMMMLASLVPTVGSFFGLGQQQIPTQQFRQSFSGTGADPTAMASENSQLAHQLFGALAQKAGKPVQMRTFAQSVPGLSGHDPAESDPSQLNFGSPVGQDEVSQIMDTLKMLGGGGKGTQPQGDGTDFFGQKGSPEAFGNYEGFPGSFTNGNDTNPNMVARGPGLPPGAQTNAVANFNGFFSPNPGGAFYGGGVSPNGSAEQAWNSNGLRSKVR